MWASPAFPFDEDATSTSTGRPTAAHVVTLPATKPARESDGDACAAADACDHPAPTAIAANATHDALTTIRLRTLPNTGTIPWPADPPFWEATLEAEGARGRPLQHRHNA